MCVYRLESIHIYTCIGTHIYTHVCIGFKVYKSSKLGKPYWYNKKMK